MQVDQPGGSAKSSGTTAGNTVSPRPVWSPSNLNVSAEHPKSQSHSHSISPGQSPSSGHASAVGRSPRDRMKIDHLLASPRSPWSPRFSLAQSGLAHSGPHRFTNRFTDSNNVKRPTKTTVAHPPVSASPLREGVHKNSKGSFENSEFVAAVSVQEVSRGQQRDEAMLLLDCAGREGSRSPSNLPQSLQQINENPNILVPLAFKKAKGLPFLPVHLFIAAIGDGPLLEGASSKSHEVLEQVIKKVSKEQNTQVNLYSEGPLHIQLRVFSSNSIEGKACKEYITAHPDQSPAPFVMLARHLPMAVTYDVSALDPSTASVADRLRKQAKTRAIKLLREVMFDAGSGITAAMLRGHHGPLEPANRLEPIIGQNFKDVDGRAGGNAKYIVFPAIVRRPGEVLTHTQTETITESGASAHESESTVSLSSKPVELVTPSSPAPRHFPVTLMVIAIGDGSISRNTQPKLLHRLRQIMNKVPKEHHLVVDLPRDGSVPVRMRLFVVNSEDAKAAREYIGANQTQRPMPFVILSHSLPIAVSYDSRYLDVSDANVVDCLRKQAKTRAVKLIKGMISNAQVGMSVQLLRGHEGAEKPADMLDGPLMQHAVMFGEGKRYISFTARKNQNRVQLESSTPANTTSERKASTETTEPQGEGGYFGGLESLAIAASMNNTMPQTLMKKETPEGQDGRDRAEVLTPHGESGARLLASGFRDGGGQSSEAADGGGRSSAEGIGRPQLSQQRICELCTRSNDGSYGTGRFCSKTCRYEAHAMQVAQRRKAPSNDADVDDMEMDGDGCVLVKVEDSESEYATTGSPGKGSVKGTRVLSGREMKRLRLKDGTAAGDSRTQTSEASASSDMEIDGDK